MGANAYVPPDDAAVDQLDVPDQSAVVVVFQYNVAAEAVDEHAKNRSNDTFQRLEQSGETNAPNWPSAYASIAAF